MRLLFLPLLLLALLRISGGDLLLVQGYAWAEMLIERAGQDGLEQAMESTFSGDAPCEKCLCISQEKKEREDAPEESLISLDKLKLSLTQREHLISPWHTGLPPTSFPPSHSLQDLHTPETLSPPPRSS